MPAKRKVTKIFVLDTSVILHDANAIVSFQEHDVALPITVLEEIDNFKKGNDVKNFNARQFIRIIDELAGEFSLQQWIPLGDKTRGSFTVVMNENEAKKDLSSIFGQNKADHQILSAALTVKSRYPNRQVILITKDINLRLKAKALDLLAEDFNTDKISDIDTLNKGWSLIDGVEEKVVNELYEKGFVTPYMAGIKSPRKNQYFVFRNGRKSAMAFYNPLSMNIERVEKTAAYGIQPRNAEQVFAMHAVLNPNVKLVSLQGVAGTGKTLLALAGAIEQKKEYRQIFIARPIVPLSNKDIGYLPGDIKSKLNPYMEPLWDNLKFIQSQYNETDSRYQKIAQMVESEKILIQPLAYIRGRSLSNIMFIVDEAQNLTPHEIKTVITRAGENTKIIFTGDVRQIDTPYLDAQSNGLSYMIDKIGQHDLYAHITLEKGERSELANLANELL
ncbi:MAG: PhoH family protein [Bacteroidetes bacterium]|jgi:PhoH-like ATPase|nr:PhoH family protein [Bacteroidota bacterium]